MLTVDCDSSRRSVVNHVRRQSKKSKYSALNRSRVCQKAFTRKSGRKVKNRRKNKRKFWQRNGWSKIIQTSDKNKWQNVFLVWRDKQIKKLFSSRKKVKQFLWLLSGEEVNYNSFLFAQVGAIHQLGQESIWQIMENNLFWFCLTCVLTSWVIIAWVSL